jgi:hypothetical protein
MEINLAYGKTGLPLSLPDEWQVQIQARVQMNADVHVYSDYYCGFER